MSSTHYRRSKRRYMYYTPADPGPGPAELSIGEIARFMLFGSILLVLAAAIFVRLGSDQPLQPEPGFVRAADADRPAPQSP